MEVKALHDNLHFGPLDSLNVVSLILYRLAMDNQRELKYQIDVERIQDRLHVDRQRLFWVVQSCEM